MKSAYEILKNDKELNNILDNINFNFNRLINFANDTSGLNWSFACHGKHHAMFVVGITEYILSALSYDGHTVELGKVAGLLHDIGVYYWRENHARLSAEMCSHFVSKTNLNRNDLEIIYHAIIDHSTGTDIKNAVGAALIIADKMTDTERAAPLRADLIKGGFTEAQLNKCENPHAPNHSVAYAIKDVKLNISGRNLIFNYFVEGDTDVFMNEYFIKKLKSTPIILTKNAATYLLCDCIYQINGAVIESKNI